jgi:hypothetical protein
MHLRYKYIFRRKIISTKDLSTILLTIGILIVYFLPTEFLFHDPTSFCIHKKLLNFDCPGCGMTRSLNCIFHGQIRRAMIFNIGILPLISMIFLHFLSYVLQNNFVRTLNKMANLLLIIFLFAQYILKLIRYLL